MRAPTLVLALCIVLAGCSETPGPRADRSPARPPALTFDARNVPLIPGEQTALRFAFSPAEPSADVIVSVYEPEDAGVAADRRRTPDGIGVKVCPLPSIDAPIDRARCDVAGSGVREPVGANGMRAVAVVADAPRALAADVLIEFADAGRTVSVRIPVLRTAGTTDCSDNACNPFFEMRPVRPGRFSATARWTGGDATLSLLQGQVIGRSATATGIPYHVPSRRSGGSPLSVGASLSAPAEYALAFARARGGGAPLTDVELEATWP